MRVTYLLQSLLVVFVLSASVNAGPCDDLKALIDKTYNFKPSKITDAQRDVKSDEMDVIWNKVGKEPATFLPCLRSEMAQRKTDTFFRFDASNLLFKHDPSVETKKLMIDTYSEADLADISHRYWLPYMAKFGFEGLDVSKAGEAWLRFPKPGYYLPRHGARLVDKSIGALAIFGSMDESIATPHLARLAAENNTDFQSIAIALLVNQATPQSREELKRLGPRIPKPIADQAARNAAAPKLIVLREGTPTTSRETFVNAMSELVAGKPSKWIAHTVKVPDGERDVVSVFTDADLPLVRKVRRYYAAMATPESPEWYEVFTQIINTIAAKSKTKSQVRKS